MRQQRAQRAELPRVEVVVLRTDGAIEGSERRAVRERERMSSLNLSNSRRTTG